MPFALLADEFHSDPKTVKATLAGAGLYARALSYCGHYVTDGFVHHAWVCEVAPPAVRKKVTAAGLWIEVVGGEVYHYVFGAETYTVTITERGYFIPDYVAFNPTRASVMEKRAELSAKRSEAGKKGAAVRWERARETDSKPPDLPDPNDGKAIANAWQADGPLPQPLNQDQEHRPVEDESSGNLETLAFGHALRLFAEIRDDHKDDHTRQVILSYAHKLPPAAFERVREELQGPGRRAVRNEGRWVNSRLSKLVEERSAA